MPSTWCMRAIINAKQNVMLVITWDIIKNCCPSNVSGNVVPAKPQDSDNVVVMNRVIGKELFILPIYIRPGPILRPISSKCLIGKSEWPDRYKSPVIKGFLFTAKTICSRKSDLLVNSSYWWWDLLVLSVRHGQHCWKWYLQFIRQRQNLEHKWNSSFTTHH